MTGEESGGMGFGAHLKDDNSRVGVFDGWHSSIGVYGLVRLFLQVWKVHHFVVVLEAKFFEHNGDLPRVWALG